MIPVCFFSDIETHLWGATSYPVGPNVIARACPGQNVELDSIGRFIAASVEEELLLRRGYISAEGFGWGLLGGKSQTQSNKRKK